MTVGKLLGGIGLFVLALFMLLGFFRAEPSTGTAATIVTFLLAVMLPAVGGVVLLYTHWQHGRAGTQRKERLRQLTLEAEVLKVAVRKGGKLTVVEVVGEMAVDTETAKSVLDALAAEGHAEVQLTDAGVIVYAFYDVQHLPGKRDAKGVLDA